MTTLTSKINDLLEKNRIELKGKHLLCCVSGGADSMALLHFFRSNAERYGLADVCACHLNHNARGLESDSDEEFVRQYCREQGIALVTERIDDSAFDSSGHASEELFRDLRYGFFGRAAEATGCDIIATGHTLNDNVETVLFRLARGTGLRGTAGIPAVRGNIIRPLLSCTRQDTEQYCTQNGIVFRIDSSNSTDRYARNVVRHHIVPVMQQLNARSLEAVDSFIALSAEADSYFEREAERLTSAQSGSPSVSAERLLKAGSPLDGYIVRRIIRDHCGDDDRKTVERCIRAAADHKKTEIGTDTYFDCTGGICRITRKTARVQIGPLPAEEYLRDGDGAHFEVREVSLTEDSARDLFYYCVDYDKLIGVASVRNRRDGDVFRSAYRKMTKPVKKILNEKGLSAEERDSVLMLTDDAGIVWMEKEGPAEGKEIGPDTKKVIIFNTLDTFGG